MLNAFPLCSSQLDCQPLRCSLPFHCVAVNWSVSLYKAVELQQAIIGLVAVGNKHLWRAQKRDVALQSHIKQKRDVALQSHIEQKRDVALQSHIEQKRDVVVQSHIEQKRDVALQSHIEQKRDVALQSHIEQKRDVLQIYIEQKRDVVLQSHIEQKRDVALQSHIEQQRDVVLQSHIEQKRDVALQSHVESRNVEYVGHSVCVCHSQCRLMRAVNSFHVNHIHCAKSCSSSMHTCDVGQATKKTITRHTSHEVTLWPWQKRHTQTHAHMHKYTSSYTHVSIHTQHTCTRTHSHTHHQHALARLARMVYLLPQCSCLESSCSSPPTAHTWAWVMACVNCGCVFHKG